MANNLFATLLVRKQRDYRPLPDVSTEKITPAVPWRLPDQKWTARIVISCCIILFWYTLQQLLPLVDYPPTSPRRSTLRPALHFTPERGWSNDPNGLFLDSNGIYHLYYQHNPNSIRPDFSRMQWGHATSRNLYTWTHHPIAIPSLDESIFSGSVIVDTNNTSGLFPASPSATSNDNVVALYTDHTRYEEVQALAYSFDNGHTFHKHPANPIIRRLPPNHNFRDPKVIWHAATGKWVMAVGWAHEQSIGIYTSPSLLNWTLKSMWSNAALNRTRPNFECSNLVPIPVLNATTWRVDETEEQMWILFLSSGSKSPLDGGSVTRYFPGTFDGEKFTASDDCVEANCFVDFGPDDYASQVFHGTKEGGPILSIGWASNLAYAGSVSTGPREGYRGMMTLPRTGYLVRDDGGKYQYVSQPYNLDALKTEMLADFPRTRNGEIKVPLAREEAEIGAVLLEAKISLSAVSEGLGRNIPSTSVVFAFASSSGDMVDCTLLFENSYNAMDFLCDRSAAMGGYRMDRQVRAMSTKSLPKMVRYDGQGMWKVQAVLDRSVLEVY
ncbi:hypothetical protein LTS18_006028 [Coniosporium uncinatum]|uniref:Uncharacterized protein n=1 Tax=Coniosporium uncinatum TaxID=93489 RepID=A0ACC3DQU3_9PEZI|nr:hypothetical protein LTS18_006028 [Coniosporium uncinatum]